MTRLVKKHGYSDVVIAFSDVRCRELRCCSPRSPPQIQNAACRHDHRHKRAKSVGDNVMHSHIAITISVQLASKRGIAKTLCCSPPSPPPPEIGNKLTACRREPSLRGNFTDSHIRSRRHDRRSTGIETQHRQSATRATGRIRRHETASFKYPSIQCYRSNSRYQVTPHRTSCPCLVSFSVGHYDVLVSTPDSMFSVVQFCDEGLVTGDRCNSRMRSRANRLGVLKKVALLIGFPCSCIQTWCLWWFVDGTSVACLFDFYLSVICIYCVMFDLRRKSPKTK